MSLTLRLVLPSDAEGILRIYAPYIRESAVTFETEVPSIEGFASRIAEIGERYPFLVCGAGDGIAGYAYASRHKERAAYLYDVDLSIYTAPEWQGSGIAYKLYGALLELLAGLGYYNAYAGIALPNGRSVSFHKKFGFTEIGTHHKTGYKLGEWRDVLWLEKAIRERDDAPGIVASINELPRGQVEGILAKYADK